MLNKTIQKDEARMTAFGIEKTVHILLADDDHQVLSALRLVLEQNPAWQVIDEFHNAAEMIRYFENAGNWEADCEGHARSHASVLLIDWELPGFQPKKHIREIRSICPEIQIVVLSVMMAARRDVLAANVDAFVSKSDSPQRVITALQDLLFRLHPSEKPDES
jgi:DNA-binding NarL/FixJ family response regulator